ncbi:hypothetical protein BDN71DRAFT_1401089, partial [Pleurotus eryngii]
FNKQPCMFQIQVATSVYCQQKDVVACAPTGARKTLSFWMPLIMVQADGLKVVMIVVMQLNLLGKQNVDQLSQVVLIINPEILMGSENASLVLLDTKFMSTILQVVFNKEHCISEWGKFRRDYTQLGILHYTIQSVEKIPFYVALATYHQEYTYIAVVCLTTSLICQSELLH